MRRRPTFTRADRVSSLMKDEVKRIVSFELTSPLARHVYVTRTKLAADMGHLRISFVMTDRPTDEIEPVDITDGSPEKAQLMLDRSAGYVARVLCDVLQLRKAPKIVFSYDKEYAQMKRVKELLSADTRLSATPAPDSPAE
ncbi:MAG: ribosome-binding factor A [Myxococcales bacterium]|nr:ribosome-binding factor A [Myxococcales bacterium]